MQRRGISESVECSGPAIFSPGESRVRLIPAEPGDGIRFKHPETDPIELHPHRLLERDNRTALSHGEVEVALLEHLLFALWELGVTDLTVEVEGAELPGFDGSAKRWIELLHQAGIHEHEEQVMPIEVRHTLTAEENGSRISIVPAVKFGVDYTLSYDHPVLGDQYCSIGPESDGAEEIAPARTFITEHEARRAVEAGLINEPRPEQAVIASEEGYSTELHWDNEPARHKVLDLLGDLYSLQRPVIGRIYAVRSGHRLNRQLARKLEILYPC